MSMGYNYEILDYRVSGDQAAVLIKNIGVAPIYRDAYVSINGNTSDYSLMNLMPGMRAWVLIQASGVSADAAPEIVCEHLVPGQKIEYKANVE